MMFLVKCANIGVWCLITTIIVGMLPVSIGLSQMLGLLGLGLSVVALLVSLSVVLMGYTAWVAYMVSVGYIRKD